MNQRYPDRQSSLFDRVLNPDPIDQEAKQIRHRLRSSEAARDLMESLAQERSVTFDDREVQDAADRIIGAVHQFKRPDRDDVRLWLRDGSVFWLPDHERIGEGWATSWIIGTALEEIDGSTLKTIGTSPEAQFLPWLRASWEAELRNGMFLFSFGAIPMQARNASSAFLISICGFGMTDASFRIVRSLRDFRRMIRSGGFLWSDDFDQGDPMTASDELLSRYVQRAIRFVRS